MSEHPTKYGTVFTAIKVGLLIAPLLYVAASGPMLRRDAKVVDVGVSETDWLWARPWNHVFGPLSRISHTPYVGTPLRAYWSLFTAKAPVTGRTLPSAYYLEEDVQFFPAGPEFKLTDESSAELVVRESPE